MSQPKVLLSGLGIPESPRWHEGRLWFCNWIDRQVVAVGLDGESEVVAPGPGPSRPMGWSIDWLPDGRLVMTGDKLRRQEPDGSMTVLAEQPSNEIVVDGRGNVYINGADFDFLGGEEVEVRAVDVDVAAPVHDDLVRRLLGEDGHRPVGLLAA